MATGDDRFAALFLSDRPEEFPHVPFNDLAAMEEALAGRDVAAVIMETIPATYGFPLPDPGYLESVKRLCERYGALYIADEVQTGLMRTGELWAISKHGIEPDILVTGKGISGGLYPISAVLVSEAARRLAQRGRFRPHLDLRRRRARVHRGAQDARDHVPAAGRGRWCTTSRISSVGACGRSRRAIPTGSPASARTARDGSRVRPPRRAPSTS